MLSPTVTQDPHKGNIITCNGFVEDGISFSIFDIHVCRSRNCVYQCHWGLVVKTHVQSGASLGVLYIWISTRFQEDLGQLDACLLWSVKLILPTQHKQRSCQVGAVYTEAKYEKVCCLEGVTVDSLQEQSIL